MQCDLHAWCGYDGCPQCRLSGKTDKTSVVSVGGRPSILRKAHPPEDWEKRFADLLKELAGLPQSFKFSGAIHQGGLASFEIVNKIK